MQLPAGHGRGEGPRAHARRKLTADHYVHFITALAGALELENPIFMGSSFGGNVALQLALRHPDGDVDVAVEDLGSALAARETHVELRMEREEFREQRHQLMGVELGDEAQTMAMVGPAFLGESKAAVREVEEALTEALLEPRHELVEQLEYHSQVGTALAVMTWNFPNWQVFRAAAPALMAGNAMVLKHALGVSRCALETEAVFLRAGAPEGLFQTLLMGHDAIPALIADDRIAAVTLTGSERAGSSVAGDAGRAIKKTVLETRRLGPVHRAARRRCRARRRDCRAGAVPECRSELHRRQALLRRAPLARGELRDELDRQVRASIAVGARAVVGGQPRTGPGLCAGIE